MMAYRGLEISSSEMNKSKFSNKEFGKLLTKLVGTVNLPEYVDMKNYLGSRKANFSKQIKKRFRDLKFDELSIRNYTRSYHVAKAYEKDIESLLDNEDVLTRDSSPWNYMIKLSEKNRNGDYPKTPQKVAEEIAMANTPKERYLLRKDLISKNYGILEVWVPLAFAKGRYYIETFKNRNKK